MPDCVVVNWDAGLGAEGSAGVVIGRDCAGGGAVAELAVEEALLGYLGDAVGERCGGLVGGVEGGWEASGEG